MNRRMFFSIGLLPLISFDSKLDFALNREGVVVEYSKELAEDLYAVHGLSVKTVINYMYGTKFNIEKYRTQSGLLYFVLKTNDKRDNGFGWVEGFKGDKTINEYYINSMMRKDNVFTS